MKREKLERYIGKEVEITFYPDMKIKRGILTRKLEFNNHDWGELKLHEYLLKDKNCFCVGLTFKCSHVKSIKEVY